MNMVFKLQGHCSESVHASDGSCLPAGRHTTKHHFRAEFEPGQLNLFFYNNKKVDARIVHYSAISPLTVVCGHAPSRVESMQKYIFKKNGERRRRFNKISII